MPEEIYDKFGQKLDVDWLLSNGWTIQSNLCLRHIMFEWVRDKHRPLCQERIEEIILEYRCQEHTEKIKETLKDLLEIKRAFLQ